MLGIKIAELRKQKGMTQEALAKELGVSNQAVSKWEANESMHINPYGNKRNEIEFRYYGEALNIISELSITCDDVKGSVTASGSISCGNVEGSVKASGSVTCDNVKGDVNASGSVNCDDIGGKAEAKGNLTCDAIYGNAKAGANIICDEIHGTIEAWKTSADI